MGCCDKTNPIRARIIQTGRMVVSGSVGITKAALGMEKSTPEVEAARNGACIKCDERIFGPTDRLSAFSRCRQCNCLVMLKAKVSGQVCPLGKWQPAGDQAAG